MCSDGLPIDNPESWRYFHRCINDYPDTPFGTEWKKIARTIVAALEQLKLTSEFRIGQSMHDIIILTANHHRLTTEPRVTLIIDWKEHRVRVCYSRAHVAFGPTDSEDTYDVPNCVPGVVAYLRRLWIETKPTAPIPEGVR